MQRAYFHRRAVLPAVAGMSPNVYQRIEDIINMMISVNLLRHSAVLCRMVPDLLSRFPQIKQ